MTSRGKARSALTTRSFTMATFFDFTIVAAAGGRDGAGEVTCYAESRDGRHWIKPKLGLHQVAGSKDNNILLAEPGITHNFSPFLDSRPGVPRTERFKAVWVVCSTTAIRLVACGLWRRKTGFIGDRLSISRSSARGAFDSQNVAFCVRNRAALCLLCPHFLRPG